jgi:cell division protein FtsZ
MFWYFIQVSITLIATGFKRQEENEGRPLQVLLLSLLFSLSHFQFCWVFVNMQASQLAQGDIGSGINRRPPTFADGGSVEIPDFLKKKGRSRYPRV